MPLNSALENFNNVVAAPAQCLRSDVRAPWHKGGTRQVGRRRAYDAQRIRARCFMRSAAQRKCRMFAYGAAKVRAGVRAYGARREDVTTLRAHA